MNQVTVVENNNPPPEKFHDQWKKQEQQIMAALPPHIPVERFMRVVMTAVNASPDLLAADRRSLFEASMKAAQDGLLPDGRDGALVIFNAKVKDDKGKEIWIKKVQWMPMVGGILKKVRNSGELLTISAYVAYENDEFNYTLGDDESIVHKPCLDDDRGRPRLVYAVAKTKDGGVYREIMTFKEVEKVRGVSKTGNSGPWKDWWDEMAKKTVIRRLAKRLPTSSDLDDLIRRDDDLYDFQGKRADTDALHQQMAPSLAERLKAAQISQGEASDTQEGFSRAHVQNEVETALTGEIMDNTATGSNVSSEPKTDDESPASSVEGDGESPALSPSSNSEREILIRYAADILPKAADQTVPPAALTAIEKRWLASELVNLSEDNMAKARSISASMRSIANGKITLEEAADFFAEALECSRSQIGGA
ncbi:recombinase RecT [Rhizobium sp. CFBP 8762]|uniref:recombinase RecT n=1 Tax=Rhizobium sp. CFBP 8762 TaxID=2775279 RepID=UPI001FD11B17|nr:recombinase RecT [Rhizobium sp. CFBP 8762]